MSHNENVKREEFNGRERREILFFILLDSLILCLSILPGDVSNCQPVNFDVFPIISQTFFCHNWILNGKWDVVLLEDLCLAFKDISIRRIRRVYANVHGLNIATLVIRWNDKATGRGETVWTVESYCQKNLCVITLSNNCTSDFTTL